MLTSPLTGSVALGAALLVLGCSSGADAPLAPHAPAALDLNSAIGPAIASATPGLAEAAIGIVQVHLDPATLTATLTAPRTAQTQGDLYDLSIRPFLGRDDLEVVAVRWESGFLAVRFNFKHPFPTPVDLIPPASASKRIDLHVFDVNALVVADGNETFFPGASQVTANTTFLANADAYRDPGATFDAAALGIANATIFPYKNITTYGDTDAPQGNYDPLANGWTGATLTNPLAYDVFPQGGVVSKEFLFDVGTTAVDFSIVTLAKYMDPRATPQPKTKRLPVPGDPTSLQYILPEAAGDIQKIIASSSGQLIGGSTGETAQIDLIITDWDYGAPVAATFPNNANLGEIAENSDISSIEISVPPLQASGPFTFSPVSGVAPQIFANHLIVNTDGYDPPSTEFVRGLVKVTDAQDDGATRTSITLDETLAPVAAVSSTRYQAVSIEVAPGASPPSCPVWPAANSPRLRGTVGIPYRLDLDAATTPASDLDGIASYEIDYNQDSTYDGTVAAPDGSDLPEFTMTPGHVFATPGTKSMDLRITDNGIPAAIVVCTVDVEILAQPPVTLDPLPAPAGINSDMANSTISITVTDNPDIMKSTSAGEVYYGLRRSVAAPTGWSVYKSTTGGTTWATPGSNVPLFANGLVTYSSNGFSIAQMANGLPCIAVADGASDLAFLAAISETATSINWGPTTNGTEIEPISTWQTPSVLPHPTNADRVYILAKNSSTVNGPKPAQISLYVTNNATAANPAFTLITDSADTDGTTTVEWDPIAVIDSTGDIHATWLSSSVAATNEVVYRKWDDTTQAWESAPVILTDGAYVDDYVDDCNIQINAANEPAIGFLDGPTGSSNVFLTKFNTSTGWTTPRQVDNLPLGAGSPSLTKYVGVAFDAASRIHVVWRDDRQLNLADEPWVVVFSADGYTKLVDDFEAYGATDATNDYTSPRLEWDASSAKMIVAALAYGIVTDGKARYRTYTVAP